MILKPYIPNNKIVNIVVGNPGEGKTIFLTFMATLFYLSGYKIFANFELKHIIYYKLEEIEDFKEIIESFKKDNKQKVAIFLDEIYRWADSRKSQSDINIELAGYVTQVRKMGVHSQLWGSTQTWKQFESRIRLITSTVYEPTIMLANEKNEPYILKIESKDLNNEKNKTIKKFYIPTQIHGYNILECYDTFEFIENVDNKADILDNFANTVESYWNVPLEKSTKLANYIFNMELQKDGDLTQKEAKNAAEYIITCKNDFGLNLKEALEQVKT